MIRQPKYIFLFLIFVLNFYGQAIAQCKEFPSTVVGYLQAHPSWSVVQVSDLVEDDKLLWRNNHDKLCPGLAVAELTGTGRKAYALALIQNKNGENFEMLVLLTGSANKLEQHTLVKPNRVTSPFVVWRVGPGKFTDNNTGTTIFIAHDSIVYEAMESTSTQFYLKRGKIHSLLASE